MFALASLGDQYFELNTLSLHTPCRLPWRVIALYAASWDSFRGDFMVVSLFWFLGTTLDTFIASVFLCLWRNFPREEGPRILKSIPRGLHSWLPVRAERVSDEAGSDGKA